MTVLTASSVLSDYILESRIITVRIGQVLLASATSKFSSCIELAYCSSAQELQ